MNKKVVLCLAWIGSALLLGSLLWFFTLSFRTRLLIERVNNALLSAGNTRIELPSGSFLEKTIFLFKRKTGSPVSVMGGAWFAINNSSDTAFVFTVMQNGITAACVALLDSASRVKTIVPLGSNALQVIEELPPPVFRFYADRIELDARMRNSKREASH